MKRIIICCDGTWNRSDQKHPTNVVKLYDALEPVSRTGVEQHKHYIDGVGTRSPIDMLPGGVFGSGLWRNIQFAYARIVWEHYDPGDELYVFGFSRGAYTARSLVGMIRKCGILKPPAKPEDLFADLDEAYNFYRDRNIAPGSQKAIDYRKEHSVAIPVEHRITDEEAFDNVPTVKCVGVWDTVGALGVPLGIMGWLFNRRHRFHDVSLSRIVEHGFHALAIDERRGPFKPTLWERHPFAAKQELEQRWFAGVHTNVGGGNVSSEQSDRALLWMMGKARDCGLRFDSDKVAKLNNVLTGSLGNNGIFQAITDRVPFGLARYDRPIGAGVVPHKRADYLGGLAHENVDPGIVDRNVAGAYKPSNLVGYFRTRPDQMMALRGEDREVWNRPPRSTP